MSDNTSVLGRIKRIIEQEDVNASYFADYIGVSRPAMNHILKERNNPSLDVILKILEKYNNINTDWLLFGKGPMLKSEKSVIQTSIFDNISDDAPIEEPRIEKKEPEKIELREEKEEKQPINPPINPPKEVVVENVILPKSDSKTVDKITIFYSNKTYDNFVVEK